MSLVARGVDNTARWLPNKITRSAVAASLIGLCYALLFGLKAKDYYFPIIGGIVGSVSAFVVISGNYWYGNTGSSFRLLLWRASCDFAIGMRFILGPAFNYYLCGDLNCSRAESDEQQCAFPSIVLEFFIIASEAWFFCNGLDLIYTITNPFSSFQSRLKSYHMYAWIGATTISLSPFIVNKYPAIYGFWYVSDEIDNEATCWLKIENESKLGFPLWGYFLCPLMVVYLFCVLSLWIAYNRLRKGLTKSFLPRLKLLVTNTANVFVLALYWLVFLLIYAIAFFLKYNVKVNATFWNILTFTFASKGFSSLVVWIVVSDPKTGGMRSDETEETIDANKSLREEVLQYATAGIRSTARAGPTALPNQDKIVRRPPKQQERATQMITPMFFLRFMMGEQAEFKAVESIAENKRRSVTHDQLGRLTQFTISRDSSIGGAGEDDRLSQRSTIVTTGSRGHNLEYNTRDFEKPPTLDAKTAVSMPTKRKLPDSPGGEENASHDDGTSIPSNDFRSQYTMRSVSGNIRDDYDPEDGRSMSEASVRVSDMIEPQSMDGFDENGLKLAASWDLWTHASNYLQSLYSDSDIVEFTEFQPYHFRRVRLSAGIIDEIYINEFSTTIKERLTQGGASGAFFFFSKGENFIAKSCTEEEAHTLERNAAKYADYMCKNKKSYISKILGAYKLKIYGNALFFFVMNNLFFNKEGLTMNEKYDIKGSWVSRNAEPPIEGQTVTCSYCEQKFVYRKISKKGLLGKEKETKESSTSGSGTRSASSTSGSSKFRSTKSEGIELNSMSGSPGSASNSKHNTSSLTNPMHNHDDDDGGNGSVTGGHSGSVTGSAVGTTSGGTGGAKHDACPYTVSGHHEPNLILKDNDIKYKIRLPPDTTQELFLQVKSDAEFLYSVGIMDYSLLVGVHNTEYLVKEDDHGSSVSISAPSGMRLIRASTAFQGADALQSMLQQARGASGLGGVVGGNVNRGDRDTDSFLNGPSFDNDAPVRSSQANDIAASMAGISLTQKHDVYRVVGPDSYFIGIIDFQQEWNLKKKMERFFKVNFKGADPNGLSAIEPRTYKDRFLRKMEDILDFESYNRVISSSANSSQQV